ncbi:hypothetical protein NX059_007774 [Plenodomus lindquistii]|nr:hypothetical protein NX059_007774 [Plenodomus lindquistii]
MPWDIIASFRAWAPFRIDALGLVTILGAQGADRVLGQLTTNRYADWLPMLGSYIIANDQITEPLPSFSLHNITDGIVATDLAGWFCRWLLCQDFTMCSSSISIAVTPPNATKRQKRQTGCAVAFGTLGLAAIILPAVIRDWWGLANGIAMMLSVFVRQIVLDQNRLALKRAMKGVENAPDQQVKVFVTLPNGKAISLHTTRGIVIECLLTTPVPPHPRLYDVTRSVGWIAFGIHVVSLGMACLVTQLLVVALLTSSTIVACRQIGSDREHVGGCMMIKRADSHVPFRAAAYARLELTPAQEQSMVLWNLFPHRSNKVWWNKYKVTKASKNFETWDQLLAKT